MNEHDEREFVCDVCDSTVRGRLKMRKHKHCEFSAVDVWKLKRHMKSHNPKPAQVAHKCPKCDSTFKCKSDLKRHIDTPHRDYVKGNSRANQYRKLKKLDIPKANNLAVCTESDIIAMLEKSDVSTNQFNTEALGSS